MGLDSPSNTNPLIDTTKYGLPVFPIPRNTKQPTLTEFWRHASTDPDFSLAQNNAAVSTGDGIIVFDFDYKPDDNRDGLATYEAWVALGIIPPTFTVRTPSGGVHAYFRYDRSLLYKNGANVLGKRSGVDIRGHHGFVVAAGSSIDGKFYEVIIDEPPAPLPEYLKQYCTEHRPRDNDAHVPLTEQDQPHIVKRALDYLVTYAPCAVSGDSGDPTTFKVAARLRDFGLSEPSALTAMLDYWNDNKAIPPWAPEELARKVANAFAYANHPAGAHDATAEFSPVPDAEAIMKPHAAQPTPQAATIDPSTPIPDAPFAPWTYTDPSSIPKREILYGNHYIRKFASATVAPGGLGKSALALAEAVAMAADSDCLGRRPLSRLNVVYFNAEDPIDEIKRRTVAICEHYNIPQSALENRLFIASGRKEPFLIATGEKGDIHEVNFVALEAFARKHHIDVFIFDPLANMTTSDETNEVFRKLGARVSQLADTCNCAVEIVHHTRKLNGNEATAEDGRGGGALVNAVRSARALNRMTREEAARGGVDTHLHHFKIDPSGGKNNLTPPADAAEWYRRVSVRLPNGDTVAVVEPWTWPDAMDGVTSDEIRAVYQRVGEGEGEGRPYRADVRAARWAGVAVAEVLGFDLDDATGKERAKQVLKSLLEAGVLRKDVAEDRKQAREIAVIVCGELGE